MASFGFHVLRGDLGRCTSPMAHLRQVALLSRLYEDVRRLWGGARSYAGQFVGWLGQLQSLPTSHCHAPLCFAFCFVYNSGDLSYLSYENAFLILIDSMLISNVFVNKEKLSTFIIS